MSKPKEFVDYGPWLAAPRASELFESPKILMRRTDDRLLSCLETDSAICVNSCHVIKFKEDADEKVDYRYVLGLLNSKLLQKIFELQNPQMIGKTFAEIKVIYVERLPIHLVERSKLNDKSRHDKMVSLVDQMLSLNKQLPAAKTDHEKTALQRRIDAVDQQIDQLVYELYGLTEEEIGIVEGSAK